MSMVGGPEAGLERTETLPLFTTLFRSQSPASVDGLRIQLMTPELGRRAGVRRPAPAHRQKAPVFTAELRGTFIADRDRRGRHIQILNQHQAAVFLEPELLLILQ